MLVAAYNTMTQEERDKIDKNLTSKSRSSKVKVFLTIGITVIVFIGVSIMFYYGEKEPVVSISDNHIQIKAMYGLDINFADITNIFLINKSMKDIGSGRRTNGYGGFGETVNNTIPLFT